MPKPNPLSQGLKQQARKPEAAAAPAEVAAQPSVVRSVPPSRVGRVLIGGHFAPEVQTALKIVAAEERTSVQSLIAEGSANLGIDMAFPEPERTAFERDSLFPLAGLDPALAEQNSRVRRVVERLNYARNEVARRYLGGTLDRAGAEAAMARYWLSTPEQAAKTVRFIDTYRSYVINYNLGRDLVQQWVERHAGSDTAARWKAYEALLRAPAAGMR